MPEPRVKAKGKKEKTQEEYRQGIMDIVCGCLAQGKPLVQILTANGMPDYSTIMRWLNDDKTLCQNYMRAREASADYLADEIVYIADTEPDPQVAKVRIDARKWVAAKMKPKRYGDRVEIEDNTPKTAKVYRIIKAEEMNLGG